MPDPVVSLQAGAVAGAGSNTHLAFGRLVGTDLAVFAVPEGVDLPADRPVHVVVSPAEPDQSSVVERFPAWHVEVASLQATPDVRACVVRLLHRSQHATDVVALDPDRLTAALDATGDVVRGLAEAGLALPDPADDALAGVLERAVAVELDRTQRPLAIEVGQPSTSVVRCVISPKCHPEPPGSSGPRAWLAGRRGPRRGPL